MQHHEAHTPPHWDCAELPGKLSKSDRYCPDAECVVQVTVQKLTGTMDTCERVRSPVVHTWRSPLNGRLLAQCSAHDPPDEDPPHPSDYNHHTTNDTITPSTNDNGHPKRNTNSDWIRLETNRPGRLLQHRTSASRPQNTHTSTPAPAPSSSAGHRHTSLPPELGWPPTITTRSQPNAPPRRGWAVDHA